METMFLSQNTVYERLTFSGKTPTSIAKEIGSRRIESIGIDSRFLLEALTPDPGTVSFVAQELVRQGFAQEEQTQRVDGTMELRYSRTGKRKHVPELLNLEIFPFKSSPAYSPQRVR